jgi:hypothetical protein
MDRETERKQWEICPNCGQKKVPHPRLEGDNDMIGWLVCPNDVATLSLPTQAERWHGPRCRPPAVLAAPFVHGAYYRGTCRNASIARYNAETGKFVYWRQKFGSVFPEDICHAGNDDGFDLFEPYAIVEDPPFEIPLVA